MPTVSQAVEYSCASAEPGAFRLGDDGTSASLCDTPQASLHLLQEDVQTYVLRVAQATQSFSRIIWTIRTSMCCYDLRPQTAQTKQFIHSLSIV